MNIFVCLVLMNRGKDLAFVPKAGEMDTVRAIPTISDNLCDELATRWSTSGLLPQRVRVVPYKV
jgi:hypothetical protein